MTEELLPESSILNKLQEAIRDKGHDAINYFINKQKEMPGGNPIAENLIETMANNPEIIPEAFLMGIGGGVGATIKAARAGIKGVKGFKNAELLRKSLRDMLKISKKGTKKVEAPLTRNSEVVKRLQEKNDMVLQRMRMERAQIPLQRAPMKIQREIDNLGSLSSYRQPMDALKNRVGYQRVNPFGEDLKRAFSSLRPPLASPASRRLSPAERMGNIGLKASLGYGGAQALRTLYDEDEPYEAPGMLRPKQR